MTKLLLSILIFSSLCTFSAEKTVYPDSAPGAQNLISLATSVFTNYNYQLQRSAITTYIGDCVLYGEDPNSVVFSVCIDRMITSDEIRETLYFRTPKGSAGNIEVSRKGKQLTPTANSKLFALDFSFDEDKTDWFELNMFSSTVAYRYSKTEDGTLVRVTIPSYKFEFRFNESSFEDYDSREYQFLCNGCQPLPYYRVDVFKDNSVVYSYMNNRDVTPQMYLNAFVEMYVPVTSQIRDVIKIALLTTYNWPPFFTQ